MDYGIQKISSFFSGYTIKAAMRRTPLDGPREASA
jgi:hypothetical protein